LLLNNPVLKNIRAAVIFTAALFFVVPLFAQSSLQSFRKLSFPEKRWVLLHPLKAKKAYAISLEAKEVTRSMKGNKMLDPWENGGQLDAFRHAYWMARLTQEMGWRRAYRLGNAHEKGNYRQFKRGKTEEGALPDEASSKMDYLNNDTGIETGKRYPDYSPEQLSDLILRLIGEGKLYIISRDSVGNFLDCGGTIINMELYKGKWQNPKCVIPSARRN